MLVPQETRRGDTSREKKERRCRGKGILVGGHDAVLKQETGGEKTRRVAERGVLLSGHCVHGRERRQGKRGGDEPGKFRRRRVSRWGGRSVSWSRRLACAWLSVIPDLPIVVVDDGRRRLLPVFPSLRFSLRATPSRTTVRFSTQSSYSDPPPPPLLSPFKPACFFLAFQ